MIQPPRGSHIVAHLQRHEEREELWENLRGTLDYQEGDALVVDRINNATKEEAQRQRVSDTDPSMRDNARPFLMSKKHLRGSKLHCGFDALSRSLGQLDGLRANFRGRWIIILDLVACHR